MIKMYCDRCGQLVDEETNGACRFKMGKNEYVFHACGECQVLLRDLVWEELENDWHVQRGA